MVQTDLTCAHPTHVDRQIDVVLDGPVVAIPDSPPVLHRLALRFPMLIWDWERYDGHVGYCPGNDEVSKSLGLQGMWEGYETVLTLNILETPGLVVDVGAHIGWYTILAGLTGHPVVAIEPDAENLRLLNLNLALNQVGADIHPVWIDQLTPLLDMSGPVRLIKMDIEGSEDQAIRICRPLLGVVDYLLVEVSPVFADHYPQTVQTVVDCGYRGFVVPVDGHEAFSADPLGTVQQFPLVDLDFDQRNVLFIREDLC